MKFRPALAALAVTWLLTSFASASTLLVEGFLEGDVLPGPERGDTMDFYKFQVFTPGSVRVEIVPGYEGYLRHESTSVTGSGALRAPWYGLATRAGTNGGDES